MQVSPEVRKKDFSEVPKYRRKGTMKIRGKDNILKGPASAKVLSFLQVFLTFPKTTRKPICQSRISNSRK